MKISKILNNNVAIIIEDKYERVVMGCGICYKKKVGDEIRNSNVDKVFELSSTENKQRFTELIESIPLEYFELGKEIINNAKGYLNINLNSSIYISLVDHIYHSITRYLDGISIKNVLLIEIQRYYQEEFSFGLKALDIIEEKFNVRLPEDEAGFIALHFINAQVGQEEIKNTYNATEIIQEICNVISSEFNMKLNEESVYYYRFISHLKFFAQRLIKGEVYIGNMESELLEVIKKRYNNSYKCANKVKKFVLRKYRYEVSDEEMLYLTIHINQMFYKYSN